MVFSNLPFPGLEDKLQIALFAWFGSIPAFYSNVGLSLFVNVSTGFWFPIPRPARMNGLKGFYHFETKKVIGHLNGCWLKAPPFMFGFRGNVMVY